MKKLFIGSSHEEIDLAEKVKSFLENDFDVTIWNEKVWDKAVFRLNKSFLNDLLKASLKFDFGLLIGTNDDKVNIRGKEVFQARDNILFELGLFTGRLGTSKCAFLVDKEIKLPSDLMGISLARFDKNENSSLKDAVDQIRDLFHSSYDEEINFFPSATLASVYVENLLVPVCRYLIANSGFTIKDIHYKKCRINVIIPESINLDVNLQFEKIKTSINTECVSFNYEGRPRSINIETQIKDGLLEFIDFPTIIAGINYAISNLLPSEFISQTDDYQLVLDRELLRFKTALSKLIKKYGFENLVYIKSESEIFGNQ